MAGLEFKASSGNLSKGLPAYIAQHAKHGQWQIYISNSTTFQTFPGSVQIQRKIHGGGKILPFLTEIAIYLGNGTR